MPSPFPAVLDAPDRPVAPFEAIDAHVSVGEAAVLAQECVSCGSATVPSERVRHVSDVT